ncbi:AAA family ATPase [Moraxella sp. VT-16-12]|uniref:AAA family ATPase n=1 Tax=Moraxella sp. VT-16-12 TaxID=2014877 RepID=UPI000B7EEC87|nr:AAA family ATPase [Moraxella sp. VT-16-12]TWV83064.1 AAA family ATPase [Moraxella sp. VT-16-12]
MSEFKSPDELFEQARHAILYQDEPLMALCVPLYYHLRLQKFHLKHDHKQAIQQKNHFEQTKLTAPPTINKAPLFITGKTGSGKTHLIKTLCQMTGVNFLVINATHMSNSGFKGMTLADIGEMLLSQAKNERLAQFSVVFFDEFDKLFLEGTNSVRDWHRALATELLTIIEGSSDFPVKDDKGIPTHHMMFILGGSFGMHQDNAPIGFTATPHKTATPMNLVGLSEYGLPDELSGRIGRIIRMNELTDDQLKDILCKSPTSPFVALQKQLSLEWCQVSMSTELLNELVVRQKDAIAKFGVRGLYQGFYELPQVQDVLRCAPDNRYHHYELTVDGHTKTYQPNYRPTPNITIKVMPTFQPEPEPEHITGDDMPF